MDRTYNLRTTEDGWKTVDPKPTPEELQDFYAQKYFQEEHGPYTAKPSADDLAHRDLQSRILLHAVEKARGAPAPGATLLDIGCGEGFLLKAASEAGYAVRGFDFSDYAINAFNPDFAKFVTFGDAFASLDAAIEAREQVDVCVMEHVMEHVADPEELMTRLPGVLKPGGVVAISVPNDFNPVQAKAMAKGHIDKEFWVVPPEHLSYFNSGNLRAFFERKGFEILGAYGDFPIDWYLFHPGSNYIADRSRGKAAHLARMQLSLTLAQNGLDAYYDLLKAFHGVGVGRSNTIIARHRG